MKDLINKLTNLEATAPKPKKMLTEDSTSPMIVEPKTRSLKDVFNELSETVAPGTKPLAVMDPQNKQAGVGVLSSPNPGVQNILKNLDPKDVQVVMTQQQPGTSQQTTAAGQSNPNQLQAGQQQVQEKWDEETKVSPSEKGKYAGKTKAELTSAYNKLKASGPYKEGSPEFGKMRELAFAIRAKSGWGKVQEESDAEKTAKDTKKAFPNVKHLTKSGNPDWKKHGFKDMPVKEEQLDELSPETIKAAQAKRYGQLNQLAQTGAARAGSTTSFNAKASPQTINQFHDTETKAINRDFDDQQRTSARYDPTERDQALVSNERNRTRNMSRGNMLNLANKKLQGTANVPAKSVAEGAKVDRMVKHIEKSERKLGKSKEKASDIAWATANKRGMLDNKNKKKTNEGYYSVRSNQLKQELENNGWERIPGRELPGHAKYGYRKNGVGSFYKVIDEPYDSFDAVFVKPRRVNALISLDKLLQLIKGSSVSEADIPSTQGVDTMGTGLGAGRSMTTLEGIMSDMSNGTKVLGNHHGFLIFLPSGHVVQPTKRPPFGQSTIGSDPDPIDDKEEWEKLPWNILEVGDPDEKDAWWEYGQKTLRMKPVDYSSLPRDLQTRATRLYQKYSLGQGPNAFAGRSFERFNKGKTMKNFAEGKWNYPEHMKKTVTTSDMGTTNAQDNRDARREFRKKEKAKAHAELMKGGKKVNEANEAETHFAILDPKLIDQISQMSGAAVEPDTNPPTVSSYDGNTVRQLLAFAQKYPDRLKKTQVLHRGLAQPAMAQPVGGFDKMGGPEYNLKEGKKKAKPDYIDLDKDGNKKESMKKASADKKKKKVDESINHRISAARLEGKSHGLRGHAHSGKRYEDLEELKAYHEGYKEGLDECYGQGVYENAPAATVPGMADDAMEEGKFKDAALGLGAFATAMGAGAGVHKLSQMGHPDRPAVSTTAPAAAKPAVSLTKGGVTKINPVNKFSEPTRLDNLNNPHSKVTRIDNLDNPRSHPVRVDLEELDMEEGNLFTGNLAKARASGAKAFDLDGDGDMEKVKETAFAFEAWDNQLNSLLNEGLSVSVSKGQQNSPDSVTITAQDAEADQLLQLVKSAGLGLFGGDEGHEAHPSSAMSIQPAHGAADEVGAGGVDIDVVDDSDSMLSLMKKLGGVESSGEEGEEKHTCNECGMMEAECQCDKEKVEEVESEDQMEYEVAEDNAPDSGAEDSVADENAEAKEDADLAGADSDDEEEMNEGFTFESLLSKMDSLTESKTEEDDEEEDEKAEKAGEKVTKDIEYDDKKDKKEKVDEWANQVGKGPGKGTDASFEQDIEFMTKVIAGGLNKPKSTGQTTIPVIAGQDDRMHDNPQDWATLAGIKK